MFILFIIYLQISLHKMQGNVFLCKDSQPNKKAIVMDGF
jgi:hypothetical protein